MEQILEIDKFLFIFLNHSTAIGWLDSLMILASSRSFWSGVGILFIIYSLVRRDKNLLKLCVLIALAAGIADGLSFFVFKQIFARMRPCFDPSLEARLVGGACVGQFGFPSNHAANAAAIALVVWKHASRPIGLIVVAVAGLVCFSRIHLGVHFPGDILGGIIFGAGCGHLALIIGQLTGRVYRRWREFRVRR